MASPGANHFVGRAQVVDEVAARLPEQPPAIKAAAATSAAHATAGRRVPAVLALLLVAHGGTIGLARGRVESPTPRRS
jgi:hypothetical protein